MVIPHPLEVLMHFPGWPAKGVCQPAQYFSGGCMPAWALWIPLLREPGVGEAQSFGAWQSALTSDTALPCLGDLGQAVSPP